MSLAPGDAFTLERQEQIARVVAEQGRARVTDLAVRFGVSTVTIRKDLLALESRPTGARSGSTALGRSCRSTFVSGSRPRRSDGSGLRRQPSSTTARAS